MSWWHAVLAVLCAFCAGFTLASAIYTARRQVGQEERMQAFYGRSGKRE
jgi:hypothetical protein